MTTVEFCDGSSITLQNAHYTSDLYKNFPCEEGAKRTALVDRETYALLGSEFENREDGIVTTMQVLNGVTLPLQLHGIKKIVSQRRP